MDHDQERQRRLLQSILPRIRRLGDAVTARHVSRRIYRFREAVVSNGVLELMVEYGFGR